MTLSFKCDNRINTRTFGGKKVYERLTVEEVIEYQRTHPYKKQVYGKWGNLKYQYLKDIGVDWTIVDLPTLLHSTDKAANELYDVMYEKLSSDERFKRTGDYIKDVQLENEKKRLIEEEILNELIYVD